MADDGIIRQRLFTKTGKGVNLLGLNRRQMEDFFASLGEKKFRARQVMKWIHHVGETDINKMTDISKQLREQLLAIADIHVPDIVSEHQAPDGVKKWIVRSASGSLVETVYSYSRTGQRHALCLLAGRL